MLISSASFVAEKINKVKESGGGYKGPNSETPGGPMRAVRGLYLSDAVCKQ
jgi:hypothetical protein